MAKPLVLRKAGRGWNVFVDVEAAKRFAPRRVHAKIDTRWPSGGLVAVSRSPAGGLDFGGAPATFSKGDADHVAHRIGRYMLELGDFVDTYVEVERDRSPARDRRARTRHDPPEPGEFERNQRKPPQHVVFRMLDDEVVAMFPYMQKSSADNRRMLYSVARGKSWLSYAEMQQLMRRARRTVPAEEREIRNHLTYDHGYRIRTRA